jgi:hypothetical protein
MNVSMNARPAILPRLGHVDEWRERRVPPVVLPNHAVMSIRPSAGRTAPPAQHAGERGSRRVALMEQNWLVEKCSSPSNGAQPSPVATVSRDVSA